MGNPQILWAGTARHVIASNEFDAYPMADFYRKIMAKTGLDFSATVQLFDSLPVFLSGTAHKERRRKVSQVSASIKSAQEVALTQFFSELQKKISAHSGEFDILVEIGAPMWHVIRQSMPVKEIWYELIEQLPDLFNPKTSLNKRLRLNNQLQTLLRLEGVEILDCLALLVLGTRPMTHSLCLSIHFLARTYSGLRLSEIPIPDSFPDSALRFVDRIARTEGSTMGCPHRVGDWFRCYSFDESYTITENDKNIYGTGAHVCLGRPISQFIWHQIKLLFAQSNKVVFPSICNIESKDPFRVTNECKIRFSDAL